MKTQLPPLWVDDYTSSNFLTAYRFRDMQCFPLTLYVPAEAIREIINGWKAANDEMMMEKRLLSLENYLTEAEK